MLGRASTPPLAHHAIDAAVARPPVVERSHRFHQGRSIFLVSADTDQVLTVKGHRTVTGGRLSERGGRWVLFGFLHGRSDYAPEPGVLLDYLGHGLERFSRD
jgi:hypothetical protein